MAGATIWLTGLPASGKTTLVNAVATELAIAGRPAQVVDGDALRIGLTSDLGFSKEDRAESVRRAGEVALILAQAGVVALVSLVSPYREHRDSVRRRHAGSGVAFVEVHVATPLEVCEQRDPKGLYAKARRGDLTGMTGVDDPYEPPLHAEIVTGGEEASPSFNVSQVLRALESTI